MKKGQLIVIAGPSGVGKGTVCNEILKDGDTNVSLSVSATTRNPREGEVDGVNYHFVSMDEFDKMIENSEFLEYANVFENKYGTPKKYVNEALSKGIDIILEIDMQGAMMVLDNCESGLFIFIAPKNMQTLRDRLKGRGTESQKQLDIRNKKAKWEIEQCKKFEYVVINDDLDTCVQEIKNIIISNRLRVSRNEEFIDELLSQ